MYTHSHFFRTSVVWFRYKIYDFRPDHLILEPISGTSLRDSYLEHTGYQSLSSYKLHEAFHLRGGVRVSRMLTGIVIVQVFLGNPTLTVSLMHFSVFY